MAVNIHNLIAAIAPEPFCDPSVRKEVQEIVSKALAENDSLAYLKAAEKAKPYPYEFFDFNDANYLSPYKLPGFTVPIEKHVLEYDAFSESLEPIYFWILDKLERDEGVKVEKVIDTFTSSPGSGHFSEMGLKSARMQEEAMKMLGAANQVIKSILSIIYDLKEFKLRLQVYKDFRSDNPHTKQSALLSLKQIWMDTVDIKRSNSAIKALAQQFDYVTIIDAFMAAPSSEAVKDMDLNDRVKRILQQRLLEFYNWINESQHELTKRFEIEKEYLRSQVNTLKLYARWVKPYLRAAHALEQGTGKNASLVTAFNTSITEVTLLGEQEYKPDEDIFAGDLPPLFKNITKKKFQQVIVVEFTFRAAPERAGQQGYGFRGRVQITLTSYALTSDELKILRRDLDRDNISDVMKAIEGATDESIGRLAEDLDEFLNDKPFDLEEKKNSQETNPFSALFSIFVPEKKEKKEEKKSETVLTQDTEYEKILRSQTIINARKRCWRVYDLYKKSHGMPSLPGYG